VLKRIMGLWEQGSESGLQVLEWRISRHGGNVQTSEYKLGQVDESIVGEISKHNRGDNVCSRGRLGFDRLN
jgi:hypothetical protein